MRLAGVLLFGSSCSLCVAQWDVPVRIELTGSQPADRQVLGLADPAVLDAGTSAEAVRSNAVSYTTTQGSAVLTGALIPAPQAYVAGMVVSVLPDEANESGAQIDLNGLGPRAIMKTGGLPLDSADLIPGSPVRLVYDGDNFIVLGPVYLPCPAGYHVGSREYCIEDSSRAAVNFYQATAACINSAEETDTVFLNQFGRPALLVQRVDPCLPQGSRFHHNRFRLRVGGSGIEPRHGCEARGLW